MPCNGVSLERLIASSGVDLKPHGQDRIGHCPFHDDKTPSLVVSPKTNLWHCLGACQSGGSVIGWVMQMQGVSFRHAVEILKNDPSTLAASSSALRPVKRSTTNKLDVDHHPGIYGPRRVRPGGSGAYERPGV